MKSCKKTAFAANAFRFDAEPPIAGPVPDLVPPFSATCRAEAVNGSTQYSRCLVDVNIRCAYRINPFGVNQFCLHPHHKEIVARTTTKVI